MKLAWPLVLFLLASCTSTPPSSPIPPPVSAPPVAVSAPPVTTPPATAPTPITRPSAFAWQEVWPAPSIGLGSSCLDRTCTLGPGMSWGTLAAFNFAICNDPGPNTCYTANGDGTVTYHAALSTGWALLSAQTFPRGGTISAQVTISVHQNHITGSDSGAGLALICGDPINYRSIYYDNLNENNNAFFPSVYVNESTTDPYSGPLTSAPFGPDEFHTFTVNAYPDGTWEYGLDDNLVRMEPPTTDPTSPNYSVLACDPRVALWLWGDGVFGPITVQTSLPIVPYVGPVAATVPGP